METFSVRTKSRTELVDITREVASALAGVNARSGACVVYVPHTTAGVTINENADPAVRSEKARSTASFRGTAPTATRRATPPRTSSPRSSAAP